MSRLESGYQKINENSSFNVQESYREVLHVKQLDKKKQEKKKHWASLPDSVNGTLIYFLMVENNHKEFSAFQFVQSLFYVGFPVYFTFYLQALLLYTLWINVPSFSVDENICGTSPYVQHAVIGIFIIFLIPSVKSIITESNVILRCDEVAFDHEEED